MFAWSTFVHKAFLKIAKHLDHCKIIDATTKLFAVSLLPEVAFGEIEVRSYIECVHGMDGVKADALFLTFNPDARQHETNFESSTPLCS